VPPVDCRVSEYELPLVADGSAEVVMARVAEAMVMEVATDFVWTGLPLSLTDAVKLKVPPAVGVPEITPVVGARVSPAGRLPEVIDQV